MFAVVLLTLIGRKEQLLMHFQSIHRLKKASESEIAGLPGFGIVIARLVLDELSS